MNFLLKWLASTLAIIIAAYLLPGVVIETLFAAFVASLILGIFNTVIKPLLILLTLPINLLTLGLFTFVINASIVMLVGAVVPGFGIDSFWWALIFSIVLALITYLLHQIVED